MNKLIENSTVKVTTAIVASIFVIGLIVAEAVWKTNVGRDLHEIRVKQDELGWHRDDMEVWVHRTERLNADWQGADTNKVTVHP